VDDDPRRKGARLRPPAAEDARDPPAADEAC
jgi:hypothetical protein